MLLSEFKSSKFSAPPVLGCFLNNLQFSDVVFNNKILQVLALNSPKCGNLKYSSDFP